MSKEIIIVEDEPIIADDLAMTLEKLDYTVVDIFDNADDTLEALQTKSTDLLLLDINIEGDKDGVELGKIINKIHQIPFVFLTSYYDSATVERASMANPYGYIVKPFDKANLNVIIELAFRKSKPSNDILRPEKFFVRQDSELIALNQEEILYAEAYDNYTYIYTSDNKYLISHTLKSIEQKLDPLRFIRTHRSFLVQFYKITSISNGYLHIGSANIPIGKVYKQKLFEAITIL